MPEGGGTGRRYAVTADTNALIRASVDEGFGQPSGEDCLVGMTAIGAGTGLLIGAVIRSDVWAPIAPPPAATPPVVVASAPLGPGRLPIGIGLRFPLP